MRSSWIVSLVLLMTLGPLPGISPIHASHHSGPAFAAKSAYSQAPPVTPPINLQVSHTDPKPAGEPTVAVNRFGTLMVDWEEQGAVQNPVGPAGMAFSTDKGRSFGPQTIINVTGSLFDYDVATAGNSPNGTFWVGYGSCPAPGQVCSLANPTSQDYVTAAWNNGTRISNPIVALPASATNTSFVDRDWIASTPNGTVYEVVDDASGKTNSVFIGISYDGIHFQKPRVIYTQNGIPIGAFAWNDSLWGVADLSATNNCTILLSQNGGSSWAVAPSSSSGCDAQGGSISWQVSWGAEHTLDLTYIDNKGVEFTESSNLGATWSSPVLVSGNVPSGTSWITPTIATNPVTDEVSIIWLDTRTNSANYYWYVYESDSFDNGKTWSTVNQLSSKVVGTGNSFWPGDFIGSTITPWGTAAGVWGENDANATLQTFFGQIPLAVKPGGPTLVSFAASPSTVSLGSSTTFSVTTSGGTPPLRYAYGSLPSGCTTANSSTLSCTPTTIGNFTVNVTVTDALGLTAKGSTLLHVVSASLPSITSFSASPNPVTVGTATSFNVTVSGGLSPYSFAYAGLPPGCASANTATLSCTPTTVGNYTVTVTVADANGKTATRSAPLTVDSAATPTITSFSASPNPVTVSTGTTFSATISGGTIPYAYAYAGLPAGCSSSNTNNLTCTPTATGTFNVTLTVTDAKGKTAARSTSLTVKPVNAPTITAFTASPNPVPVNTATSLSVTVSGGTTPYTYSYAGLPTGCASSNTATLSCTPTASGSSNVTVTVTDANSKTATSVLTLVVNPANVPTITSFSASPNPVVVNTLTTFSVAITGGTSPYTYAYTGLPLGCSSSNTNSLSCTPTSAGTFNVTVTVTDASGKTASKSTSLIANPAPAPTITSFSASPNPVTVNAATTFSATVSGGTLPFAYSYTGLPTGCASSNTHSLSCTPTVVGTFIVTLTVTDANGQTASKSTSLTVKSASSPTITSFSASLNPVPVGTATTISVAVTGGTLPYSYVYTGLPAGCSSSNASSLLCKPNLPGKFEVNVTVTDAYGKTAHASVILNVNPSSTPSEGYLGLPMTDWILILATIAAASAIAAAVIVMGRRRKRGRASAGVPPPPEWME